MAKAKKPRKPPAGSHPASVAVAVAIRELLKAQRQQAVLKKRVAFLKAAIVKAGGGTAHGYRAYASRVSGGTYYRTVVVRPKTVLKLVKVPSTPAP